MRDAGIDEPRFFHARNDLDRVAERFARGGLLLDTGAYKIDAGRRDAPACAFGSTAAAGASPLSSAVPSISSCRCARGSVYHSLDFTNGYTNR